MASRTFHLPGLALCLSLLWCGTVAHADEVRVLAAGAAKAAMERLAPEFARQTGHTVRATYDTVGAQRDRVLAAAPGAVADVVILSAAAIAQLGQAGRLQDAPSTDIGSVVVALAVQLGAPAPDISTAPLLRQALLAAPSIAFADPARGATAGSHFAKVLDALDLRAALQSRLHVLPFGVDVITDVSKGRYALGVSQSSEIVQHEGITLVGALPAPYNLSTRYAAALATNAPAATELLKFLSTDDAVRQFRATGFLRVP